MKTSVRNLGSLLILFAFVWMAVASNKDEEIFVVRASATFDGDAITLTNTDAFSFNEYSLSLLLPGGADDPDANYTLYTINLPITAGSSRVLPLTLFTNLYQEGYPNLVRPEKVTLNVWHEGKLGLLELSL